MTFANDSHIQYQAIKGKDILNRRFFIGSLGAVAGINPLPLFSEENAISIVATTSMIADTVRSIGQGYVKVKGLMGPGIDPHSYRHTRNDIVSMTKADLTLRHGLDLEAQMEDFFADLSRKRSVVAVTNTINPKKLLDYPGQTGRYDPHVWMDPILWSLVTDQIALALSKAKPAKKDEFQTSATNYKSVLNELNNYAKNVLSTVPSKSRVLITAHDAFGYFGKTYGFEVIGVQGISTNSEAGLYRIKEIVDLLVEREISAVFVESSVSDRNMRALIEGTTARGHEVTLGGELYSDAMGIEGTYEGTYVGMLDHNITTIAKALGGNPPDFGWQGKLKAT